VITIIGAGALGSHVALFLRNMEQGLKVVDFDRIEAKNVMSQFHTKMSLGKNKAQAVQQSFQGLFGVKIDVVPHRLVLENAKEILGGADLIIDCTDRIAPREIIQLMARELKIPCLHGALAATGDFGRVIWSRHFVPDAESGEGATCEDGRFLPFFAMVSAVLAAEAQSFLKTGSRKSYQITPSGIIRVA